MTTHEHTALGQTKNNVSAKAQKASEFLPIKLIVGLGNPGDEYSHTRHNAGFNSIDILADRLGARYWKQQLGALVTRAQTAQNTRELILVKPQSFMNSSGGPLSKLLREFKIRPQEILVIHDELDIPAGDVRLKFGGGHAGHNGIRSIIDKLQTKEFAHLRVGIGRPPGRMSVVDFVLQQLKAAFLEDFNLSCQVAADACELCLSQGFYAARNTVNGAHKALETSHAQRM